MSRPLGKVVFMETATLSASQCLARRPAIERPSKRFALANGRTRAIDGRAGVAVLCESGRLWLTQTGEAGDVILERGGRFVCRRGGRVVVEALADSVVRADPG